MSQIIRFTSRCAVAWLVALVRLYQWLISPLLGTCCRFQPPCSEYFIQSLRRHGVFRGLARGLRRIARCHPWGASGYDPP